MPFVTKNLYLILEISVLKMNYLKRQTRRYAKRQLTWFKKDARINWIFVDDYINFKEILNFCTKTIEKQKNM